MQKIQRKCFIKQTVQLAYTTVYFIFHPSIMLTASRLQGHRRPVDNLESFNLTCICLEGGRKPERSQWDMQRTCKLHTESDLVSNCDS